MSFLTIMAVVIGVIGYVCLAFKIGFMVSDATENTGFNAGFYAITVFGLLALPIAIAAQVMP
jgi:hypothetical protein